MERFKLLSDSELFRIDQASRALLSEVGVQVTEPEAQHYFDQVGAKVDAKTGIVKIPNHVINETLSKCMSTVRLYNRRNDKPLIVGGDEVYFGTVGVATNVLDLETNEYRAVVTQDLIDIIQLGDVLDPPDYLWCLATPMDVPSTISDLIETKSLLLNTTKHFVTEAQNTVNCRKTVEMAVEIAGSLEKLQEKPFITMQATLTSPLHFRKDAGEVIIEWAKYGLPMLIESGPMAGGTSPVTMAGTLITANAELLHAFVLAKAVNPDVPLIYASWARLLDMRGATCSHGGPEFAMLRAATTQLAKYYNLPSGGGCVLADTKSIDVQLGMEKLGTGLLPALAGTNMCTGMGLFADENAISMETLIIDNEVTNWIKRVLKGFEITEETCDLDIFREVGHGGDFVSCPHTMENFKKETFLPSIMDRGFLALDKDPLKKCMRNRARARYPKLMKKYIKPEVTEAQIKRIDEIIES